MIDFIKGTIAVKTPTYLIVETAGGVGYRIQISLHTYALIEKLENIKLLTHLQIREDAHSLYGFAEETERSLFLLLTSVSGVGATTAQVMLSAMNPDELRGAILGENEAALGKVKGIGPKTAKRIILDLKDKVQKDSGGAANMNPVLSSAISDNKVREEALSALVALGFPRINVQKVLNQILKTQPSVQSVEDLIKNALRQMS